MRWNFEQFEKRHILQYCNAKTGHMTYTKGQHGMWTEEPTAVLKNKNKAIYLETEMREMGFRN